jgi:sugar phosphate isomerase/epimerase
MSAIISHPQSPSIDEQIKLFAAVGFDAFFLSAGVTDRFDLIPHWASVARASGITFEAVHAPSGGVNAVWQGGAESAAYDKAMRRIINLCADGDVSKLVMHVGSDPAIAVSDTGLHFWQSLADYAQNKGVHLCFENANTPALLEAVLQNTDRFHGFCHDTGHQLCYTPAIRYERLFSDRLLFTHLHDNHAHGDEHLLPQDGVFDWEAYVAALKAAAYAGTLNLELSCTYAEDYRQLSFLDFVRLAFLRICTLKSL